MRLVFKGYVKQYKVNYEEIFAPMAKMISIWIVLALVSQLGWDIP
jgi:hypothetical protein